MNKYTEMKARHRAELDALPIAWAFSNAQFAEGMKKLGFEPNETEKICSIGAGGFMRKEDAPKLEETHERQRREMDEAIAADATGDGFIYDMFHYELGNHEYAITRDHMPAFRALGLTVIRVGKCPRLSHGFDAARQAVVDWYQKNN